MKRGPDTGPAGGPVGDSSTSPTDVTPLSDESTAHANTYDELLSQFTLAHVEGSATVAAYACGDLLEMRRSSRWNACGGLNRAVVLVDTA